MGRHSAPKDPVVPVDQTITGAFTLGGLLDALLDARNPSKTVLVRLECTVAITPPKEAE